MEMNGVSVVPERRLSAFERARLKRLVDERVRDRHSSEDAAIAALKRASKQARVG